MDLCGTTASRHGHVDGVAAMRHQLEGRKRSRRVTGQRICWIQAKAAKAKEKAEAVVRDKIRDDQRKRISEREWMNRNQRELC